MTARRAFTRPAPVMLVLAAIAGLTAAAGCAEAMGKRAASGAVAELRQQSNQNPGQQPSRIIAANAVEGAVGALDTPEQRARIDRLVAQAVSVATTAAVATAARQLVAELGPEWLQAARSPI